MKFEALGAQNVTTALKRNVCSVLRQLSTLLEAWQPEAEGCKTCTFSFSERLGVWLHSHWLSHCQWQAGCRVYPLRAGSLRLRLRLRLLPVAFRFSKPGSLRLMAPSRWYTTFNGSVTEQPKVTSESDSYYE